MDDDVRERVERRAEVDALYNAVKHDSEAQVGAILGPLMSENPEFREYGDEIAGAVAPVVGQVNEMSPDERRARLEELAPERVTELEAEGETDEGTLPDLPDAEPGDVRMRVAPNPNGPWHIGHARMAAVVGRYAERYDGSFICRFDDTDPETKRPTLDAYDAILDAIGYLGFEPDDVVVASDRLETYYEHGQRLIDTGGAYTCSCPGARFSEQKNAGEACPHRNKNTEQVHEEFDRMVRGGYDAGEMVLRVRTDIEHPNPALRDWVAFRMVDTPHPRPVAAGYRCWPMLDFQSGVDDHLTGVTHIIRGIDLQDSAKRQAFVYDYFDWEYPEVVHWGHVEVDAYDVPMSTSSIQERIETGELDRPASADSCQSPAARHPWGGAGRRDVRTRDVHLERRPRDVVGLRGEPRAHRRRRRPGVPRSGRREPWWRCGRATGRGWPRRRDAAGPPRVREAWPPRDPGRKRCSRRVGGPATGRRAGLAERIWLCPSHRRGVRVRRRTAVGDPRGGCRHRPLGAGGA